MSIRFSGCTCPHKLISSVLLMLLYSATATADNEVSIIYYSGVAEIIEINEQGKKSKTKFPISVASSELSGFKSIKGKTIRLDEYSANRALGSTTHLRKSGSEYSFYDISDRGWQSEEVVFNSGSGPYDYSTKYTGHSPAGDHKFTAETKSTKKSYTADAKFYYVNDGKETLRAEFKARLLVSTQAIFEKTPSKDRGCRSTKINPKAGGQHFYFLGTYQYYPRSSEERAVRDLPYFVPKTQLVHLALDADNKKIRIDRVIGTRFSWTDEIEIKPDDEKKHYEFWSRRGLPEFQFMKNGKVEVAAANGWKVSEKSGIQVTASDLRGYGLNSKGQWSNDVKFSANIFLNAKKMSLFYEAEEGEWYDGKLSQSGTISQSFLLPIDENDYACAKHFIRNIPPLL